jgi:hypothetical protein
MHTADKGTTDVAATIRRRLCYLAALALVAHFLTWVAGFYQTGNGFTVLIGFTGGHDDEVTAMSGVPHAHIGGGYDGQFYAQLALVPLLHDPAIDRALDNPPYRARRILFGWTAYAAGFGKPAWILQAYALQNVVCWLLLAWLLVQWIPPDTPRRLASWAACLFGQGLLASVRLSLTDGPSMLLLACAAATAARGRLWSTAAIVGASGLGRETNLFGLTLLPRPRTRRQWMATVAAVVVAIIPLLLWQDYLFSIYRRHSFTNQNQLAMPFSALLRKWDVIASGLMRNGPSPSRVLALLATLGLNVQAVFLLASYRTHRDSVWWRLAMPYVVLMFVLNFAVWSGYPGAASRVLLPMTFAFNILLNRGATRYFWLWYALGNAALCYAPGLLPR